jgi:hypothetical protein
MVVIMAAPTVRFDRKVLIITDALERTDFHSMLAHAASSINTRQLWFLAKIDYFLDWTEMMEELEFLEDSMAFWALGRIACMVNNPKAVMVEKMSTASARFHHHYCARPNLFSTLLAANCSRVVTLFSLMLV